MTNTAINKYRLSAHCTDDSNWLDYALIILIIGLTGFQFCFRSRFGIFFLVGPLAAYMFKIRNRRIYPNQMLFLGLLLVWEFFQVQTGQSTSSAMGNFYIRFIVYLIAASSINEFEDVYVKTIYIIAIISLPFWAISNYLPGGYDLLSIFPEFYINGIGMDEISNTNPGYSIGFYYVAKSIRNSGPFWEPGMYVVFLVLAYSIHLLKHREPFDKISIVLLLAIITTFSTTGYCAIFIPLILYYTILDFKPRSLLVLVVIGICVFLFLNSDFGMSKIADNSKNTNAYSRFGAVTYHFTLLQKYLLTGRGFASEDNNVLLTSPNGITMILLFWGVLFGAYYYYLLYVSSKKIAYESAGESRGIYTLLIFSVLIIVAFSQDITTRHFYYFLLMYGLTPTLKNHEESEAIHYPS